MRAGGGGLVSSVYSDDREIVRDLVLGIAPLHGRVTIASSKTASQSIPPGTVLPQLVLAHLMESGDLERHLRLLRRRHQRRRDAMITALSSQLPEAEIHGAAAGLHLMISFATAFSDVDLAAAAFDRGVKV